MIKRKVVIILIIPILVLCILSCGNLMSQILIELTELGLHQIIYDSNGADGGNVPIDDSRYAEGEEITLAGNTGSLSKAAYSFCGWNTASDGSGTSYTEGAKLTIGNSDVTLYAQWSLNPTYRVIYDANGADSGSVPVDSNTYEEGWTITAKANTGSLVLDDYFFTGWNTSADNSGSTYKVGESCCMGSSNLTLYAQWIEPYKLLASDGETGDQFGYSSSIYGDYAVIGAAEDGDNGYASGAAYIYRKTDINSWGEEYKISASDGTTSDFFGYSVSICGDYLVVGARLADGIVSQTGAAYVYHRTGQNSWGEECKIVASDGSTSDYFGYSVSIFGDYLAVSAYGEDTNGLNAGAIYIYHRTEANTWEEEKITASDGLAGDFFGFSVSIFGDYVVSGARYGTGNVSNSGTAYIYHRTNTNSWGVEEKLIASDGAAGDSFGWSVALSESYTVISANFDDNENGDGAGSAYIYRRTATNSWEEEEKLIASEGEAGDVFGRAVAISGDYVIIGSRYDDIFGEHSGSAYIYHRTGTNIWGEEVKIFPDDGAELDYFGWSLDIYEDYAVIGGYGDDDKGSEAGSAWIYNFR